MEKQYLKNMPIEQAYGIVKNNTQLFNQLYEYVYEDHMMMQEDMMNQFIDPKTVQVHERYSSFYLELKYENTFDFIRSIDDDYLTTDDQKLYTKTIELVHKIEEDLLNNGKYFDEVYENAKTLLKTIENYLHAFEDFTDLDLYDYYYENLHDNDSHYILGSDTTKVYEDITKQYI